MQHPNKHKLELAVAIIVAAQDKVVELLTPDLGNIALGVKSRMDQLTGFLTGIGGLTVGVNSQNNAFPTLAEVAEAEGIEMRKAVGPASTTLTNEELDRFRARVESMGSQLHEMTDDQILATVNTPEGEKVIRGTAKQLGFADFREVPIDIALIARLRVAGEQAANVQAQQDALRAFQKNGFFVLGDAYDKQADSDMAALERAADAQNKQAEIVIDALGGTMDGSEVKETPAIVDPVTPPIEVAEPAHKSAGKKK